MHFADTLSLPSGLGICGGGDPKSPEAWVLCMPGFQRGLLGFMALQSFLIVCFGLGVWVKSLGLGFVSRGLGRFMC